MPLYLPNGPFYNASSATTIAATLLAMGTNLVGSSAVMNATSAVSYANTMLQASSCILGLLTESQQGFQVSS